MTRSICRRALPLAVVAAAGWTNWTWAQDNLMARGAELYDRDCALCHQPSGAGDPPGFPALSGNPAVADLGRIVENIHDGRGNMPAFPTYGPEDIAAVATFIRGSWANGYPAADPVEVSAIIARLGGTVEQVTIWEGVYTEAQAERGADAYRGPCGTCHGQRLNGAPDDPDMRPAPALARYRFIRNWDGRTLATLFLYTRATMPQSNPGYMDDQTYADIIAYMLATTGAPAGDEELLPDPSALARIAIVPES